MESNELNEIPKVLKEFIKLKEMKVIIHNYNDALLFLKDDIQLVLESRKQKDVANLLGLTEPNMTLMVKFFKSLDNFGYTNNSKEFNLLYDNTSYTLVKE